MDTKNSFDSINRIPMPSQMEVLSSKKDALFLLIIIHIKFRMLSVRQVCIPVFQAPLGNQPAPLEIMMVRKQHEFKQKHNLKQSFN
jgi:hypothetical protein